MEHGFGQCVHLPPQGMMAVRQYRKAGEIFPAAGGPTRVALGDA